VVEQLAAKLAARRRLLEPEHRDAIETLAGSPVEDVLSLLRTGDVPKTSAFVRAHPDLFRYLDRLKLRDGSLVLISEHEDASRGTERGYGNGEKPEDYLAGFGAYLKANQNAIDALLVVMQRPRELTRAQLRALKLRLDQDGYPESALRTAWAEVSNQDIAASIIGFIRQGALGAPLVPYEQRVARALQRVMASQPWTGPQRKWLERIGKQLQVETVVDRDALDRGQFQAEGGFARLNKVFGGKLEQLLGDLHEEIWRDAG
jgi:type I restriction enzyme R subunit